MKVVARMALQGVKHVHILLSLVCLYLLCLPRLSVASSKGEEFKKKTGKCKDIWRPEKLVGRCFGLKKIEEWKELGDVKVEKASECRSICCALEEKCVSWQFQNVTNICWLGGIIRLGLEATGTPDWCDPSPPAIWSGNRVKSREGNTVIWGESLPHQCFGLGPERERQSIDKNDKNDKDKDAVADNNNNKDKDSKRLTLKECRKGCANDPECGMFQWMEGRGCFYASSKGVWCEEPPKGSLTGGRKCIPNYCGGLESQILKQTKEKDEK